MAKTKNVLEHDPTRTITLRNKAASEINRRFGKIKQLINESIITNKIFVDNAKALKKEDFVFLRTPQKLEKFDDWLASVINELILTGNASPDSTQLNWLLQYFQESYTRGAKKANTEVANVLGRNQVPERISVTTIPFHVDKLQLLFSRDFTQLKGITEAMSQQINYQLSQGLLQGQNPNVIAKNLTNRVDKIGISRSRLLARTEIINTLNLGKINEAELLEEILGEKIVMQWQTSGDDRVRQTHISRNGKYYTPEKTTTLIGEPNCRCATIATPVSAVPDNKKIIS